MSVPFQTVTEVRVERWSLAHDAQAVKVVLHRELLRFWYDKTRMVSSLSQPVLWLLAMGTGLSSLMGEGGGVNLKTFIFPGVIGMSVLFTAMLSAASIVWDREFGFLREMLVAPVSRSALVIGKTLGGTLIATLQGLVIVALAGFANVPYDPVMLAELIGLMLITSFAITAFGVVLAARIRKMQAFFGLIQMVLVPMMFLSGTFYPLSGLPGWLTVLTRLNPVTYVVDPLRHVVFSHVHASPAEMARFNPSVTWGGWPVPVGLEVLLLAVLGVVLLGIAIMEFRRTA